MTSPSQPGKTDEADTDAVDLLRQRHSAEVASIQEAFAARTRALHEDLQVGSAHPRAGIG